VMIDVSGSSGDPDEGTVSCGRIVQPFFMLIICSGMGCITVK
jgi:hypothetical protein